jgi:anti-sigma regulatory factor (Ser/Thr protein kinase)
VDVGKAPRGARHALRGHVADVAAARRLVEAFVADCDPPADPLVVRDALLAVSELVTNAVRHAPGPCTLSLCDDGRRLTIAVSDTSPRMPRERDVDVREGVGGLGLRLLQALCERVETQIEAPGKTVSVTLDPHRPASLR